VLVEVGFLVGLVPVAERVRVGLPVHYTSALSHGLHECMHHQRAWHHERMSPPPPPPHARHAPIPARPSRAHGAKTAGEVTLGRARNGDRKIAYREASGGADLAVVGAAVKLLRRRLRLLKDAHHLGHGGSFERVEDHAPSAIWGGVRGFFPRESTRGLYFLFSSPGSVETSTVSGRASAVQGSPAPCHSPTRAGACLLSSSRSCASVRAPGAF
jgi:hypothetical protein